VCSSVAAPCSNYNSRFSSCPRRFYRLRPRCGGNGVEPDVRLFDEQVHRSDQNTEMDGPQMGVQVIIGLPLLPEEYNVFSLNILVAIAAYAALLAPNRAEYCFKNDSLHH